MSFLRQREKRARVGKRARAERGVSSRRRFDRIRVAVVVTVRVWLIVRLRFANHYFP